MSLPVCVLLLGFLVSLLSGFVGIGGGIVMAPALLLVLPLVDGGPLGMHEVSGLTITQGLFACLAGAVAHGRRDCVDRRLVAWMGAGLVPASLLGALLSGGVSGLVLTGLLAGLAAVAAAMMWLPVHDGDGGGSAALPTSGPAALALGAVAGFLCGMVGQGGSFLLVPLMIHVLGAPTRIAVGSNLALVFLGSLAAFSGKAATGQVPFVPAAALVAGAVPGALLGAALSHRTSTLWLRRVLAAVVALAAVKLGLDAFSGV